MNLLPPLSLLKEWREGGLSPQEIYARCQGIKANWRPVRKQKDIKSMNPKLLIIALRIRAGVNSVRDLSKTIGNDSGNGIMAKYLRQLRAAGLVTWQPGKARTLKLTERGQAALASYCLLPDGGVGKIEKIGEAEGKIDG